MHARIAVFTNELVAQTGANPLHLFNLGSSGYYLAESLQLTGDDPAARDAVGTCLELNPNHGRALASLA